eukprot:scaffold311233_cov18-Tisochrysis_lutea.AAC.1
MHRVQHWEQHGHGMKFGWDTRNLEANMMCPRQLTQGIPPDSGALDTCFIFPLNAYQTMGILALQPSVCVYEKQSSPKKPHRGVPSEPGERFRIQNQIAGGLKQALSCKHYDVSMGTKSLQRQH